MALFDRLEGGKMCFGKHRLDDTKDLNVDQCSCLSNGTSNIHSHFCVANYWYGKRRAKTTLSKHKFTAQTSIFWNKAKKRYVVNSLMYPTIIKWKRMWDVEVNFHVVLTASKGGYGITRLSCPSVRRLWRNVLVAAGFSQTACYKAAVIGYTIRGTPCNYVLRFIPMLTVPPGKHTSTLVQFGAFGGRRVGSIHSDKAPSDVNTRRCHPTNVSSYTCSVITLNSLIKI
jgi:hypothetical protein